MNDANRSTSPGNIRQTVGNLLKFVTFSTLILASLAIAPLTSASTTAASSTPFSHIYAYNKLGNILSMTGQGTYTYPETGYMNPHAVGMIGNGTATTTFSYDSNGNLTSAGSDSYGWDFKNRLVSSTVAGTATSYGYDHTTQRVFKAGNNATTTFGNKYFNYEITGGATTTATTTKHVFTPVGELIATITTAGATTTKQYIHTDHLGGTNVVTDNTGINVVQVLDYYPFGDPRVGWMLRC